jgi:hypothetical protein
MNDSVDLARDVTKPPDGYFDLGEMLGGTTKDVASWVDAVGSTPMMNRSRKIGRNRKSLFVAVAMLGAVVISGCQDWPDERGTAIEAQNLLRDISRIETVSDANIPVPDIYLSPPKKIKQMVGGAEEWKLIYFCKHHTANDIKQLIHEQFATQLFNKKGQSTTLRDYTVSAIQGTNQLIVRCPTEQDIDAVLEIIAETDIPPIQVKIECLVSELYADLTVDRETTLLIENLFGESIHLGGKIDEDGNVLPAFPGASLRDPARELFGLKVGISSGDPGHQFEALVDILVSRGYLKILMNPTLEVVNGQTAEIQSRQHVPLQQVTIQSGGFGGETILRTQTEYYDIIDSLEVTPHVFADGYIGLETTAQISAYLTPEGIKQLPIVTERTITNKDNRIRHGESLVIGGIRKSEKRDVIRGVPILKDIPILNMLFSGRDFEERGVEVIFILTPTISTGGRPNEDMVEMLKRQHSSPMTQGLHEAVMDPLGLQAREEDAERQIDAARTAQQQLEAEMNAARLEAMETGRQIDDLTSELEETKGQVDQLNTKAEEAASKAEAAEARAIKAADEAQKARTEAAEAKAEAEKIQAESEAEEAREKPPEPKPSDKQPEKKAETEKATPPDPNKP